MPKRTSSRKGSRSAGERTSPRETEEEFRQRVRRARLLGTIGLVVFSALFLANFYLEFNATPQLLPGGHSELYFLVAIVGIFASAWHRFDWGTTQRRPR
jgi:hypothetical protein